ncbi:Ubiquitin-associated domain [Phytophthora cactorum]|nr:Ubiquitin-associated domain [Phytophthora cactorum]
MASGSQQRQIQVLLTLHDGERSFGMSLAQKSPALGPKYTVVSSVFANSPADRAGIRKGYVVRCINDKPVGGLTVAQVANHFRNVGQAKITLDVVESIVSPRTSAFAAAATFGGVVTLPNRPATQAGAGSGSVPVTGFSAVSSGRAIAAPGSALAPESCGAEAANFKARNEACSKTLGLQPQSGVVSSASATVVSADAKTVSVPIVRAKVWNRYFGWDPNRNLWKRSTSKWTTSSKGKGKGKAKKTSKHHHENNEMDDMLDDGMLLNAQGGAVELWSLTLVYVVIADEVLEYYVSSSDSDLEESPSTKTKRRTGKGRRRGVTDRSRHSLTIDRLLGMGFTQEDAEASVKEVGNDPDECMLWIISKIEERQFTEDLNQASIQSEQSKRDEEKRVKKKEKETIAHAEKFMALFPTSYMICSESTASNLKNFLQSTIDQVDGEAYIREVFSKLLSLEGKSIRWYKEASRSYMLELAGRLDTELGAHDVSECCARVSANDANSPDGSCAFIRKVLEEVKALTTALFEMPTNQGGVPPVFLECDETTKFDLEDDGFEVIELNE